MSDVILDKVYIEAANIAAKSFVYGEVIPKAWLIQKFMLTEPEHGTRKDFEAFAFDYMQNVEGFREVMLKEHRMHLSSVRGKGYLITKPQQQTDVAMERLRGSVRSEIKRAVDTLTYVNEELLSMEDIRKRDEAHGKIAAITAFHRQKRVA
jgi:hypothetical protein